MRSDGRLPVAIDTQNGSYKLTVSDQVELWRTKKGGPLITIARAKRATVRGLKIDGHTKGGRGIDISDSESITIEGCLIWSHWTEVDYRGKEKGTITDPYSGESEVNDSSSGAGIRIRGSKTVDISANHFNNNRCDKKYSVPSPFDLTTLKRSITIKVGGQEKELSADCAKRLLRMRADIYRNGGGAIFVEQSGGVNIEGNLFQANAAARGGAVRFGNKAYEWINDNYFSANSAWVDGGAIAIWDYDREKLSRRQVLIKKCRFSANTANDDGGAVYLTAKTLARIVECSFEGNGAGSNGGALRVTFGSTVEVTKTTFTSNIANTDADTKITDNKDGGGAAAVQNASVSFTDCTFTRNRAKGFAGGALYVNTVKYDEILEQIGKQVYDDNFDNILKNKYRFTEATLRIERCDFSKNDASGKTCYAPALSNSDKIAMLIADDCDDLMEAITSAEQAKQCDLGSGSGMTEGGAGGAIYLLEEKSGYLTLNVDINNSTFNNDTSQHHEKEQRAAIVALACVLRLRAVTISVAPPTLYKLSLQHVTTRDVNKSGLALTCSNLYATSTDPEIYLLGVICF